MIHSDTTPDVQKEYDERWGRMSPEQRFLQGLSLIALSRQMLMAGLAARHPNSSQEELKTILLQQLYTKP